MNRRSFATAGIALVALAGLAACGNSTAAPSGTPSDKGPTSQPAPTQQPAKPAPTAPAEPLTLAKFQQITQGMSYEQVVQILGAQGTLQSQMDMPGFGGAPGTSLRSYTWSTVDGSGNISISFTNNAVTSTMQFGLR